MAGLTTAALKAAAEHSLAGGQPAECERCCAAWLDQQPGDPDALRLAAMAALAQGRAREALSRLDHALQAAPGRGDLLAQQARVLSLTGRIADALRAVDRAMAQPDALAVLDADTLDTLGVVLSRAHAHTRACALFEAAAARAPAVAAIHFNHASSLKFLGRFDDAEAAYEACLARDPLHWKAHSGLAHLRTATLERNHLPRLEALAPKARKHPQAEIHLHQALAKEHEDLGHGELALRHWQQAKQARRQLQPHDARGEAACRDLLHELFGAAGTDARRGACSREPIFVVGMPRSGTTLVDRILSSHPDVHSAGELQNFAHALKRAAATPGRNTLDVETLRAGHAADPAAIGEAYVASTRPGTGHRRHFIDKMPLNFWYAGHIHRALPEARIVCLLRHPLDTVLSNFRQLFSIDNPYYSFADDLADCARYVAGFHQLVALWQRRLGPAFAVVRYERLIAEPEATMRALLDHCRLDWHPRCLHFEQNAAPVSTASSVQVRRPLNAASVGRWRRHESALAEARAVLEAAGVDCSTRC